MKKKKKIEPFDIMCKIFIPLGIILITSGVLAMMAWFFDKENICTICGCIVTIFIIITILTFIICMIWDFILDIIEKHRKEK